jgi:hypothetical protein
MPITYSVFSFKPIGAGGELVDMRITIVVRNSQGAPVPGVQFRIEVTGASPARTETGTTNGSGVVEICLSNAYPRSANLDVTTFVTSSQFTDPSPGGRRTTVQNSPVDCN